MRTLVINIICLCWVISIFGQKPQATAFEKMVAQADNRMKQGKTADAIKHYNVARILAGADKKKNLLLNQKIELVFNTIERQKQDAINNEQKAKLATNDANALYWTSEAEKINPIQCLRLTEKALAKTKNPDIIKTVRQATESVFNQSNKHQWREKSRFENISNASFSSNSEWLVTQYINGTSKVWSIEKGIELDFLKQGQSIRSVESSPDRKLLVTHDNNYKIKVWSLEEKQPVKFLKGEKNIRSVSFSSDNKWLITDNKDDEIKVWSLKEKQPMKFLKGEKYIRSVHFSPDNKWLISTQGTFPNFINKVWSLEKRQQPDFLKEEKNISYVTFSPDSKWLVTSDKKKSYKIWSATKEQVVEILEKDKEISNIDFSFDSKWIIVRYSHYSIGSKLLPLDKGQEDFLKGKNMIRSFSFILNNKWLETKDKDYKSQFWSLEHKKPIKFLEDNKEVRHVNLSPDNKWLVTVNEDYNHQLWSVLKEIQVDFLRDEKKIRSITFSSNSKWVLTKDKEDRFKVWSLEQEKQVAFLGNVENINDASFSEDSKFLFTKYYDGTLKIWSLEQFQQANSLKNEQDIKNVSFSPNSKWLLTKDTKGIINIWSVEKEQKAEFLKAEKNIHNATFSPNEKWLITINSDSTKVWSVDEKRVVIADLFKGESNISHVNFSFDNNWFIKTKSNPDLSSLDLSKTDQIYYVKNWEQANFLKDSNFDDIIFSPNSEWILTNQIMTSDRYNFYELWNVHHGKQTDSLVGRQDRTFFSPDSKWLVAIDEFQNAKVLSLDNKKQPKFLEGEEYNAVVFSPNGQWLVELQLNKHRNRNYLAKVWSVESGKYYDFLKEEKEISYATFSPDSKWLLTNYEKGTYKVWSVETGKHPDFLKEEKTICLATFSPDSKWLITKDVNYNYKVWSLATGKYYDFLNEEKNISSVNFSEDNKILSITTNHKVKTYETTAGKLIQTLWLNKVPTKVDIIDNRYLYVTVGKAIVKTDIQTQQGNLMSFGDGEELDYKYEEIQEWIKAFGDKYLLPLEKELKKKYGIK